MTKTEKAGIDWWNSLTEFHRAYWCARAGSPRPVDAYHAWLLEQSKNAPR